MICHAGEMQRASTPRPRPTMALAVAAFVVLAMPKASVGVAWPSMGLDLGRDIGDLGAVVPV